VTRVALDTNVLIYAEVEPETEKGRRAAEVILGAARDGVIPVQVLGEFLRFIQRRAAFAFSGALKQVSLYRATFVAPPTTEAVRESAAELASNHNLQFWDVVVCAAAISAGAEALLTEDMQDGRTLNGLRLINPFHQANSDSVDRLLST
jgi:predicted nucleic acid-binding protein